MEGLEGELFGLLLNDLCGLVKKFLFCNRKGTARAIVMSCEQCSDIINLGHGALY